MPQDSDQVSIPVNKTSVLDKNVPNPLAKNPNIHTHKVFATVGLILIGVIVILGALAFIYRDQVADLFDTKTVEENTTTTKVSTSSATPATSSAKKDETADWLEYKDTYKGKIVSYKYPNDWKVTKGTPDLSTDYVDYNVNNGIFDIEFWSNRPRGCGFSGPAVEMQAKFNFIEVSIDFLGDNEKANELTAKDGKSWSICPMKVEKDFSYEVVSTTQIPTTQEKDLIIKIISTFKFL